MPSLLKRKPEASAAAEPAWHPNFRNFERLPDTKVVRTAFFVNGGAILLALAMLAWFGVQQYRISDLKRQIGDWDIEIARDRQSSDQAVALFKKFQAGAAQLTEIDQFVKAQPVPSVLLLHLAKTLPANIALESFELRAKGLRLMNTISGSPDEASGYASSYVEQLRADPVFKQLFEEPTLLNLSRQTESGRLLAEIVLDYKGADKKK